MRIDAHQHFWNYDAQQYPWIPGGSPLERNFLPADLSIELEKCDLDGCIAVQARQSLEETRWLLELASQTNIVKGVVGWVDLRSPDVTRQLEEFSQHENLVGVRHVVQDEADDNFMLGHQFQDGIRALDQFDLTYDVLIYPRQLPAAIRWQRIFPTSHLCSTISPSRSSRTPCWSLGLRKFATWPNIRMSCANSQA